MLKSILTTSIRNLLRNRSFSLINMIGLSVSMSLSLLIIQVIREQYTFDEFHQDADRIYRVNTMAIRTDGRREPYASTPMPLGRVLMEDYAFAENVVKINRQLNGDAIYKNVNVPISGLFVDGSFLEVFNFELAKGSKRSALKEPNSLVLSQKAAKKIFGTLEPLGQTITLSGYGEYVITGLLKEFPGKTHLDFEVLASTAALPLLEKNGSVMASLDDWNNYYMGYVYLKLRAGKETAEVEQALREISKKYYANLKLETRDRGYEFYLQPLRKITPGPQLSNNMGNGLPDILLIFLGTLAGIVMLMACFNYTNLMIAKSLSRAREIGIRKIVGAKRWQVFAQFVVEAIIFSLLSLALSYVLMQFLKPAFLELHITREFSVDLQEDLLLYFYFLSFAIVVGLIAGLLPAGYLSAFRPLQVLKETGNVKVYAKLTFRNLLMVGQFTLSIIFITVVLVIYRQIDFVLKADYGFKQDHMINVRLQGLDFTKLANEVRAFPGVTRVGGVSHSLGTWQDRADDYKRNRADEPFVMRDFIVDDNYLQNLEIQFVAGNNFDPSKEGPLEKHVILNEAALKEFRFSDAASAVGQAIYVTDSVMLQVIGVVKDFNFRPLNYQIGPLALRYKLSEIAILNARVVSGQEKETMLAIGAAWKRLDPIHPVSMMMMEAEIDKAYVDSGFTDALTVTGYIAFLAICLACLGMLGMAMYSTQTRVKEIGVRKVMGASVTDVVILLSRSFIALIIIAVVIGTPISYFLGSLSIESYAYRIEVTPGLLLTGIGLITVLGVITICSQTIRAALLDPVKSLRYE